MTIFYAGQSLSHGTMRNEDLLQTFGEALERACNASSDPKEFAQANAHHQLANEALALVENGNADSEAGSEVLSELFDALNYYAPKGCAFGAHEGDGSDYGFWGVDDPFSLDEDEDED